MNKTEILSALDEEISRLRQARDLLADASLRGQDGHAGMSFSAASGEPAKRKPGRPKGSSSKSGSKAAVATASQSAGGRGKGLPKRRAMSAEGKARIAEAQRARWARQHEAGSKSSSVARKGAVQTVAGKTAKKAAKGPGAKQGTAKTAAKKGSAKKVSAKKTAAKKSVDAGAPQSAGSTATA